MELHYRALFFFQYVDVLIHKLVFFMLMPTCYILPRGCDDLAVSLSWIFNILYYCSINICKLCL